MRSPVGNHELRPLLGDPTDIGNQGQSWVRLSGTMDTTVTALEEIVDSPECSSKGTDKLEEMASSTAADLKQASTRYLKTGEALTAYADALKTAQDWISTNQKDVEAAEVNYQTAKEKLADAQADQRSLKPVMPWDSAPTAEELAEAQEAVNDAQGVLNSASTTRDSKWSQFDLVFETWSDEYDLAATNIQAAMDTAGNNDGFWEFIDAAIEVIGIVLVVLTVVALIIGAPFTGLLAGIILTLTLVSVGLTFLKLLAGRATGSDMAWSLVSLLPFGIGRVLSRGAPVLTQVVSGGRGIVTNLIRNSLPQFKFLRPSTWSSPVKNLFAPLASRFALPTHTFVNPMRSLLYGSADTAGVTHFLQTLSSSRWGANPAVVNFIAGHTANLPGKLVQRLHLANWFTFMGVSAAGARNVLPEIPFLKDLKISW